MRIPIENFMTVASLCPPDIAHILIATEARVLAAVAGSPYVRDCFLRIAELEESCGFAPSLAGTTHD